MGPMNRARQLLGVLPGAIGRVFPARRYRTRDATPVHIAEWYRQRAEAKRDRKRKRRLELAPAAGWRRTKGFIQLNWRP